MNYALDVAFVLAVVAFLKEQFKLRRRRVVFCFRDLLVVCTCADRESNVSKHFAICESALGYLCFIPWRGGII